MKHLGCLTFFVFFSVLGLTPVQKAVAMEGADLDPPLPARLLVAKVSPMIQAEQYTQAIETILAFQARGGPLSGKNLPDPKGYHHPELYFLLGNCYLLQQQYDQAIDAYRKALQRDASKSTAWLNLAKANYEKSHFAEAGDCFQKAYATATRKNPELLYYSAASYMMAQLNQQAILLFHQLFSSHPDAIQLEWKEHFVHALLETGQPRQALSLLRELAQATTGKKQLQWQERLSYQYLQLKMRKEALTLARSLTRQNPTVAQWWKALVHVQLDAGRQEEALMALTVFSFLSPLSREEKKLFADLQLLEGIPVKARPLYEACLNENPQKETLLRLTTAYRQLEQVQEAIAAINNFDPDTSDEELLFLLGELYYSLDRFDQAAAHFQKAALQQGTQSGFAWLMAGYAAWQMDDLAASKAAFQNAAISKKHKKAANIALQQLETAASK